VSFRGEHVVGRNLQQSASVNSIFYNLFSPKFRVTVANCTIAITCKYAWVRFATVAERFGAIEV
jgi:hypothetical protein